MNKFPQTLVEIVERKVKVVPEDVCFVRENGSEREPITHQQFYDHLRLLAKSLENRGLKKGDRVGILARPSYEWEVADKAIMFLGGITVGLDYKSSPADRSHVMKTTGLKGLFVENGEMLGELSAEDLRGLDFIYFFDDQKYDFSIANKVQLWGELKGVLPSEDFRSRAEPQDVAVIIFTSGTTGTPKGIPFRHEQLTASLPHLFEIFREYLSQKNKTIAWVPLFNGTGRSMGVANYYLDFTQYFLEDPAELFNVMGQIQPTYLVVVPYLLEKVYQHVKAKLKERSIFVRMCLGFLMGLRRFIPDGLAELIVDPVGITRLRQAIWGKNLKYLISGSAPCDPKILRYFDSMGVPTFEVYGLSEMASLISMNRPREMRYGSVGQIMDLVEVKFGPDQEVLVKSVTAAKNYWGEEESSLYDPQGYLKTGDLGEMRDSFLYLIGRKKEIIKTSTGQRISPVQVERVYGEIPGVNQFVVIGNNKKFLTALVSVTEEMKKELIQKGENVDHYIEHEISKKKSLLAPHQQVKRFFMLERPLSVEEGELTLTMKVRRSIVEEKYQDAIRDMYLEEAA
jgi:long-chain acyl-CoA synthetase